CLNSDADPHGSVRRLRRTWRRGRRNAAYRSPRIRRRSRRNASEWSAEDEAFRCPSRWLLRRRCWRRSWRRRRRRRGRFHQQQLVTVCRKEGRPDRISVGASLFFRRQSAVRAATPTATATSAAEPVRRCRPLGDGRRRNVTAAAGLPDRCDGLPCRERAHRGLGRLRHRR
ncbi:MAG: hypothetical protein JWQ47_62, partial [Glaciihabitans sp.]|nr:hypothetical protein [Glaciihabitans sp.]